MTYDEWLVERHSRWQTSDAVLREAVTRSGLDMVGAERLVVGQANEVYSVATSTGVELVVRMSHRSDPKFAMESAVIERVRRIGVPAPDVLLVWTPAGDRVPSAVIVERRLPGEMLRDLWRRAPSTAYADLLGELVARIHSIEIPGFGNLSPTLRGSHTSYGDWFINTWVTSQLPLALAAVDGDVTADAAVREAEARITSSRDLLDRAESRLAHGDVSATNVLVAEGVITGIVDWEAAKGAPRSNDIAWWSTYVPEAIATAFTRGYERVAPVDDEVLALVHLSRLRITTSLMAYSRSVGNHESLRFAIDALHAALRHRIL